MSSERLRPFFSYFGSKFRLAPKYPEPKFKRVVELFAGSACYSLLHFERDVVLFDLNTRVAGTWDFLINASERDILGLPDLKPGQTVDDLKIPQEARWFIGWWCNAASTEPKKRLSKNALKATSQLVWGARVRARVANQLKYIRHWRVFNSSFEEAPFEKSTWFVDPPYQRRGHEYTFGSENIDFKALGNHCKSLPGQVIVCEGEDAKWLPFKPLCTGSSAMIDSGVRRTAIEQVWYGGK